MWLFYAFMSAISASFVAIFAKLGLKGADPTLATTIRAVIMTIFFVVVSLFLKKFHGFSFGTFSSKDWVLIFLSAIAGAVSWLFYFWALKLGLASKVSVIDRLSFVFVILLAAVFLGEALKLKTIFGVLVMIAGVLLIIL